MEQVRTATKSQEEIGAAWERHLRGALLRHTGEVPVHGHLMKRGEVIREIDAFLPKKGVLIELKRLANPHYYTETVNQAKAQVAELSMHIDSANRGRRVKKLVIVIVDADKIGPGLKLDDNYRIDDMVYFAEENDIPVFTVSVGAAREWKTKRLPADNRTPVHKISKKGAAYQALPVDINNIYSA